MKTEFIVSAKMDHVSLDNKHRIIKQLVNEVPKEMPQIFSLLSNPTTFLK